MRWLVGLVGVAVFVALGVASIVTRSPGPLVPLAAFGAVGVVAYMLHPETFDAAEVSDQRGRSALAIAAWIVGIAGVAACIVSLLANIDILLFVGVFMCLAAALLGARAAERGLPSSVPKTWWGIGRRALTRKSRDAD